jgi:translation initiation factor 1
MVGVCPTCGLPKEVCICEEIAKEQQRIRVYCDRRRYGKVVTVVEGIQSDSININELASKLKAKCAAGGTVKEKRIELQGEHRKKVQESLEALGFTVEVM